MLEIDKVWLACAIDTDGYITIKKENKTAKGKKRLYYLVEMGFGNNNKAIVEKFANLIGKKVYEVNHHYITRTNNRNVMLNLLTEIYPYLIVKIEYADIIMAFILHKIKHKGNYRTGKNPRRKDEVYYASLMKVLHQ